jgi:hypothetical protein
MKHGLAINMMPKFGACFSKPLPSLRNGDCVRVEATVLICPEALVGSATQW